MNIRGLQKTTLLDYPGHVASTIFTAGCNFRCPFCHNGELVLDPGSLEPISEEEVLAHLNKRRTVLDGVCISGGEPTLDPDLTSFLAKVRETGLSIKLDTNGYRPEVLRRVIDEGRVDYVAMDIKTSKENYLRVCGIKNERLLQNVIESVEILKKSSVEHEFRTTTAKELQTKEDFEKIGHWLKGEERYFIQQYETSGELIGEELTPYEKEQLQDFKKIMKNFVENVGIRGV